ncbi:MAG TPA: cysteine desulfurase [Planctomycetota bacterium]|jgi:cysteine desulfurase/selenocysteine lyase|nr:cysteine desulfurase [Planctomycetota bacterium]
MTPPRDLASTAPPRSAAPSFDPRRVRADFPILAREVHGKPLVYLDNAASAQKPRAVLDAMNRAYETSYANVHRGIHRLSEEATKAYEGARLRVARFLRAAEASEIVFVRGTTEAINLVAGSFGRGRVEAGDEILLTGMEHHSNIVPWQLLCEETGARLRVVPVLEDGRLDLEAYSRSFGPRTRLAAFAHVSNVLGTVNPVREMVEIAHRGGVPVLVDGAQAVPRLPVDVRALGCDFYVFSGHKLYGPTGIGALYGRKDLLEAMPPWQGGGEMILSVTFEKTTFKPAPHRFEAGTPDIVGAIGLGAAIDYLEGIGLEAIDAHERALLARATEAIAAIPRVRILGTAPGKVGVLSFVVDRVHAHDVGTVLDLQGIAVRAGHHCAQPLMERFGVPAAARASFGLYNLPEEADALAEGVAKVIEVFGG